MTIRPVRLRLSRAKGFDLQAHSIAVNGLPAVNCARPGKWGNLFKHPDPAEAVAAHKRLLSGGTTDFHIRPGGLQFAGNAHPITARWDYAAWAREHIDELRGRNLACWCGLDAPCHVDTWLKLANPPAAQPSIDDIIRVIGSKRFPLTSEAELQAAIAQALSAANISFTREVRLSPKDKVDFMVGTIAIEAKIKGGKLAIYRQCERYCECPEVSGLVLATSAPIRLPETIAGKPAALVDLGRKWL